MKLDNTAETVKKLAALLRETQLVRTANISETLKQKLLAQLQRQLDELENSHFDQTPPLPGGKKATG
ncbi:MAG: hypothetical protein [Microvirus sp.]|nr:MAG: hypothetical protein [Microvirus sp.]